MNYKVKISIVMPVYNSEKYLEDCIDSILKQDFAEFELLLVDDGSTDRSPEICDNYALKCSHIKVFHKENEGICAARNYGIKHAVGEYIAFSDHDDKVRPGFLKDNYNLAKKYNADLIKFGRKAIIIRDGEIIHINIRQFNDCIYNNREQIQKEFLYLRYSETMTCVWDALFKRDFILSENICFSKDFKTGGEDIAFCSECFIKANIIVMNSKIYYEHYIRIGYSTSTKYDSKRLNKFKLMVRNLDWCIDYINADRDNIFFILNIMKEYIYPSMVYFWEQKGYYDKVKEMCINVINNGRFKKYKLVSLIKHGKKYGVFAWLFQNHLYLIMYALVCINKKIQMYRRGVKFEG